MLTEPVRVRAVMLWAKLLACGTGTWVPGWLHRPDARGVRAGPAAVRQLVPAASHRPVPGPARRQVRRRGRTPRSLIGPVRRPRRCVLAAGIAVAVALGQFWRVHITGITPSVVANRHLIRVSVSAGFAGMGGGRAGCRAAPAAAPGYGYSQHLPQRGVDHLRHRPAGAQLTAGVRSQAWRPGDQSSPKLSTAHGHGDCGMLSQRLAL